MNLLLPIIIAGLVAVLIGLFFLQRRQRANEVTPPPELGTPIDYTAGEFQEPDTFADRVRKAPLAVKLLVPLALLGVLILGYILYTTLQPGGSADTIVPTSVPVTMSDTTATLRNSTQILVQATTNLPDTTSVQAALLEGGQPFDWYKPESAQGQVFNGKVQLTLTRRDGAPTPSRTKAYSVALRAKGPDGADVSVPAAELSIPTLYATDFFSAASIAAGPTGAATSVPKATVQATAKPKPTVAATPTPPATATLTATVINGGNVRKDPNFRGAILDQNNALESVTLIEKTADGLWYKMTNPRGTSGWFSASLLKIDPSIVAQVPVEGVTPVPPPAAVTSVAKPTPAATPKPGGLSGLVRNGGNLRKAPNGTAEVLDQNNAGELVQLLAKSANGAWYKLTNPRGITGWSSASLLTIDAGVAAKVPVER